MTEVCDEVLGVLVTVCPGLITLITRVVNLFAEVLGTITNLVPEVVVMFFLWQQHFLIFKTYLYKYLPF